MNEANDKLIMVPLVTRNAVNNKSLEELFSGVIGQEEAIKKLAFFVQSDSKTTPFPTMLFTGSQGLGKSYLASKTTKALVRRFVEVNCGTIQKAKQFIEEILLGRVLGETPVTLFLDEAHKLSSEVAVLLLSFLNPLLNIRIGWHIEIGLLNMTSRKLMSFLLQLMHIRFRSP